MALSKIYKDLDIKIADKLKLLQHEQDEIDAGYLSFYEKPVYRIKFHPLLAGLLVTLFFFTLHFIFSLAEGKGPRLIIKDFSFFLSILNGVGFFLLLSATKKLRSFIVRLIELTDKSQKKESKNGSTQSSEPINTNATFSAETKEIFKKKFLGEKTKLIGLLVGILNVAVAFIFGIPYIESGEYFLLSSFILQVFVIGFIGGITVNGLFVVIKLIYNIKEKDIALMYFYPDKCAGTLIIGHILFLFSIHFIIIGLLIFLFIHRFPWLYVHKNNYVDILIIFWKVTPFLLSALIFFVPVQKVNNILKRYKLEERLRIRHRMSFITNKVMEMDDTDEDAKEIITAFDKHYENLKVIDDQISEMNTWPYNLKYRTIFLGMFLPSIIGIIIEMSKDVFIKQVTNLFVK